MKVEFQPSTFLQNSKLQKRVWFL